MFIIDVCFLRTRLSISCSFNRRRLIQFESIRARRPFDFDPEMTFSSILIGGLFRINLTRDDEEEMTNFTAAAVAVEACPEAENGLLCFRMHSDGSRNGCLTLAQTNTHTDVLGGVSAQVGGFAPLRMNGQEVYKFAVREVPAVLKELLEATGTSPDQLDWLLLHQANQRILDAVAQRFSMPQEQVLSNLAHYGNTSAATIPLMLDEAVKDGRVQPGHLLASSGFGAGLSWGGALLRWSGP